MRVFSVLLLVFLGCQMGYAQKKKPSKFNYTQHFPTDQQIEQSENKLERLHLMLLGHYSNERQADTATVGLYKGQEIISIPIWKQRKGEYWIYRCRFLQGNPNFVVGETIMQLSRYNRDTFKVRYFQFKEEDTKQNILAWTKAEPFKHLNPKDLVSGDCDSYAVVKEDNTFELVCPKPCKYEMSGDIKMIKREGLVGKGYFKYYSVYLDGAGKEIFEYPRPHGLYFERLPLDKIVYDDKFFQENK